MNDKEEKERDDLNLEIQSRKEVLKKIENAFKRLKHQAEANYENRKAKIQSARDIKPLKKLTMRSDMTVLPKKSIATSWKYSKRAKSI